MAIYNGFFDSVLDEETGKYDLWYDSGDFTEYLGQIIGSGVCIHNNPDSMLVRMEEGTAIVSPGYLFIRGYWLKNDADYAVPVIGSSTLAIVAHLNLGKRMIEIEAQSVAQAYPDALVLSLVNPVAGSAEDTRYNTDICGVIDSAGGLFSKVEWAINYIDNEIESKLAQVEQDINAQAEKLDLKIAEVQAIADSIVPPPVGSIKFSASQNVGSEWLRCDGSFINERDYPELVAALGKLTPSGDKFRLVSDGEIGPQITNGVVYGGRMWVYSFSEKKLYGVDLDGEQAVKEIAVTSEDELFGGFSTPAASKPLALSIVPSKTGGAARLFLAQIIQDSSLNVSLSSWKNYFLIYGAEFSGTESSLDMKAPFSTIALYNSNNQFFINSETCIPYVISVLDGGSEAFYCATSGFFRTTSSGGRSIPGVFLKWKTEEDSATASHFVTSAYNSVNSVLLNQRVAYTQKNKGEAIIALSGDTSSDIVLQSSPFGLFSRGKSNYGSSTVGLTVPGPINIVGGDKLLFEYSAKEILSLPITALAAWESIQTGLPLPSAVRTFIDAAAYLWGKDIYMIFVGTGIIFSRTLEEGSFGYLDTTGVLGTITQFGCLDYSQDENTLYLLGQDTNNRVKVAKMELNTLYDYANDGAWLPMLASDGVPAYIKAKGDVSEDSGPTVPIQITVENSYGTSFSVLFNGEKLVAGTYTRMVSENGTFSVGFRKDGNSASNSYLLLNGSRIIVMESSDSSGTIKTENFKTQDYVSAGINLTVS